MEKNKELTPMMELLQDLKETKITGGEALNEMNDTTLRNCSISILNKTLDCIIDRIETELLPKEKQGIEDAYEQGKIDEETIHPTYSDGQDYYNTKYNNQIK